MTEASREKPSGFDNIRDTWPQRLLHVGKMESIPLDVNNNNILYEGSREPAYNILSYSRYKSDVFGEAISITGPAGTDLGWEIPKISVQNDFSAKEFKQVLKKVAADGEFIWVDIACVNQVKGSNQLRSEIGKQAAIFHRAKHAFVWLHQTPKREIEKSMELMNTILSEARKTRTGVNSHKRYAHDVPKRKEHSRIIERLFHDPWFSSVWTLQDAYLRKDAVILSKEGQTLNLDQPCFPERLNFHSISTMCTQIRPWIWQTSQSLIDKAGFAQIQSNNPLTLLRVLARREAALAPDRIYGIMQIFGLRLGNTAEGVDCSREFSLKELEEQFSYELIRSKPILSQIFVRCGKKVNHLARLEIGLVEPDRSFTRFGAMLPGVDKTVHIPDEFYNAVETYQACDISINDGLLVFKGQRWDLTSLRSRWITEEGQPSRDSSVFYPAQKQVI